jgi:2,4-dienoyl-CoA reductase-like NADH-dependent reductase (Old Yellow Enzyme family)
MPDLFTPLKLRNIVLPNRIAMSPMCQYSSTDGVASVWHFVHLASRAVGGAGLLFTEAAAILPDGRISPQDLGIWSDRHIDPLARITRFIQRQGSVPGIQLAHAGRKGSTYRPGDGQGAIPEGEGGWPVVAPSALPFADGYARPQALTHQRIGEITKAFAAAAERALQAGFHVIEIHAAHGYLLHEFLSPLSNVREDQYGGSFGNRTRFLREVIEAVRSVWPERYPVFVRISATDWADGGWDPDQSVQLAQQLRALGVDLIDCSSGGNVSDAKIPIGPGYQTCFAERVRHEAGLATGAVGMITWPEQADNIIRTGQADLVFIGRELLRDPYWPLRAARELSQNVCWPAQYLRAAPVGTAARVAGDKGPLNSIASGPPEKLASEDDLIGAIEESGYPVDGATEQSSNLTDDTVVASCENNVSGGTRRSG